jgi:phosphoribosylformylglycinamidine synthase subunit PurL
LYNETINAEGISQPIYPTPVIGMVGMVDVQKTVGQAWQNVGDRIYLLGTLETSLAGSEYLAIMHNLVTGNPQPVDFELERKVQSACRYGISQGWIVSAHDCAEGGLAVAIAESCISGNLSAQFCFPQVSGSERCLLFGESPSRILVSVAEEKATLWEAYLKENLSNHFWYIGNVGSSNQNLVVAIAENTPIDLPLAEISQVYNSSIPKRLYS